MGFKREDAVDALHASDNNLERAIEMLTTGNNNGQRAIDDDDDRHHHNKDQPNDSATPHELVRLCEMLETHRNQVRSIVVRLFRNDDKFKKALMEVATKINAQVKEKGGESTNNIDAKDEIIIQR
uniref:UBA domain-containing protein n=1 Tax=Romanomermis culicivorax TaxID=13658 RepID=A0A915KZ68_ROMCU